MVAEVRFTFSPFARLSAYHLFDEAKLVRNMERKGTGEKRRNASSYLDLATKQDSSKKRGWDRPSVLPEGEAWFDYN
jgi:hypothetical protein